MNNFSFKLKHIRIILAEQQQRIIKNMKIIFLIGFISTTAKSFDNALDSYVEFPGKFANKNCYRMVQNTSKSGLGHSKGPPISLFGKFLEHELNSWKTHPTKIIGHLFSFVQIWGMSWTNFWKTHPMANSSIFGHE